MGRVASSNIAAMPHVREGT